MTNFFFNYLLHSSILLGFVLAIIKLPRLQAAKARDLLLKVTLLVSFLSPFISNQLSYIKPESAKMYLPALPVIYNSEIPVIEADISPINEAQTLDKARQFQMRWSLIPLILLGFGGLIACVRFARAWWILRSLISKAQLLPKDLLMSFGLNDKVKLFSTPMISSPVAFGFKTIIVPEQILNTFSSRQLQVVLAHEVSHLKRLDPIWNALFSFLTNVCFFQPLNFIIVHLWRQNAEEICDAEAVYKTKDPLMLAQSILEVTRHSSHNNLLTMGMASKTHLSKRIETLLNPKEISMKRFHLVLLALVPLLIAVILPLFSVAQTSKVVVLDAGHGGHDFGAVANGIHEADLNLSVALKVKALLEQQGITVIMTREKDKFVELKSRLDVVTAESDIFLALHTMTALSSQAHGIETWTAGNEKDDSATKEQLVAIERDFAQKLQANLISATGAKDRGARESAFFVLRQSQIPSVLIEMGFISNPEEAQKLVTEEYQQTLAEAISTTLIEYLR